MPKPAPKSSPKRQPLTQRPRSFLGPRAARLLWVAGFACFWMPISQCAWLNFVDPWFTRTMVDRMWDRWREEGTLSWPESDDVALEELPREVARQFLSGEDQRFFEHGGFDWSAIDSAWERYRGRGKGKSLKGASTISQQVSRNVFLWQNRSWVRKGLEAWYTVWLELLVPKERILEVYLNVAELGPNQFGVEAAAQHWYGKTAKDLSPKEAASLASLLPAPRSRDPKHPKSQKRAAWMLKHPAPWRGEEIPKRKK